MIIYAKCVESNNQLFTCGLSSGAVGIVMVSWVGGSIFWRSNSVELLVSVYGERDTTLYRITQHLAEGDSRCLAHIVTEARSE